MSNKRDSKQKNDIFILILPKLKLSYTFLLIFKRNKNKIQKKIKEGKKKCVYSRFCQSSDL